MAYFSFANKIMPGETINTYNYGKMERVFTCIDDIIEGIERLIPNAPISNSNWDEIINALNTSFAPYRIF